MMRIALGITAVVATIGCHGAALEADLAGPDFAIQGEYRGEAPLAAQVVATGGGKFLAVFLAGGLPGEGWDGKTRLVAEGRQGAKGLELRGDLEASIADGKLRGTAPGGGAFVLERIERRSPTLGAPAPEGARVLFDGSGVDHFDGEMDERGLLAAGATTKASFQDFLLHLEFRTPFMPTASGQARGNSGVYLQNRYEVQVLDSFGLTGEWNECGGIYEVSAPSVNMAYPPLSWQTYDIEFTAARFDAAGARSSPARITVRHNGVTIQDDVELPGPTGLGDEESPEPGPIHLQDHWNPVFYRNIWILERRS